MAQDPILRPSSTWSGQSLTVCSSPICIIIETIQSSSMLEVQGGKVRRRNDWDEWLIPLESNVCIPSSSAAVPGPIVNNLTAHLGGVVLILLVRPHMIWCTITLPRLY